MRVLLDTHALVWFAEANDDLSDEGRSAIEEAALGPGVAVSAITFWEVAMLTERRRLTLALPVTEWRLLVLAAPSFIEAPVTGAIGIEAARLLGELHADPADRIIVATARLNGWRLATRDQRLLDYAQEGFVKALRV